jgi:two-component system chemotaxis response regulator CheB
MKKLAAGLPADLPAAVFVATHLPHYGTSIIPEIISQAGELPARHAINDEPIKLGRIYVAPPGHHLMLDPAHVRVTSGPTENGFRPAIDVLFRSAARTYRNRVIGVILTGLLDDGTAGLLAVKRYGGVAIVQDPEDAMHPNMPRSALTYVEPDYCLPLDEIAPALVSLVRSNSNPESGGGPAGRTGPMNRMQENLDEMEEGEPPEGPALSACPACGGVVLEMRDGNMLQFQCRVGHRYSPESLLAQHAENVETAMWVALRSLEEHAALSKRMANHWRELESERIAAGFDKRAAEAEENAALLRKVLTRNSPLR